MTIGHIVYRIRNTLKENSRDSRYSNRHLWNTAFGIAKKLMLRDFQKITNSNVFTRFEFETETVNLLSSCVPIDCEACRIKLPETIASKEGLVYKFIGTPDYSQSFTVVSPESFRRSRKLRGKKSNFAFIDSGYLYLSKCYPCIVGLILSDDLTDGCSKLKINAPIPDHLEDFVVKETIQELGTTLTKPVDIVANKNDRA